MISVNVLQSATNRFFLVYSSVGNMCGLQEVFRQFIVVVEIVVTRASNQIKTRVKVTIHRNRLANPLTRKQLVGTEAQCLKRLRLSSFVFFHAQPKAMIRFRRHIRRWRRAIVLYTLSLVCVLFEVITQNSVYTSLSRDWRSAYYLKCSAAGMFHCDTGHARQHIIVIFYLLNRFFYKGVLNNPF